MKITRMHRGDWGKIRAFFDLQTSEGFTIKGFKLVETETGMFVGFPSEKQDDGSYSSTVWCETKDLKNEVGVLAHNEYHNPTIEEEIVKPEEKNNKPMVMADDSSNLPF